MSLSCDFNLFASDFAHALSPLLDACSEQRSLIHLSHYYFSSGTNRSLTG